VHSTDPQRRKWWQRRGEETESRALTELDVPWMSTPTAAGVAITSDSALRIVDVLACVRLLAESASVCPLIPYRRTGESRQRSTGALRDLLARPAPATSQANLIASTVGALALRGNAYWGKFRSPDGAIAQLAAIPPDRVSVALAGSGDRAPRAHARHESIHPAVHVAPDLVGGGAPMHLGTRCHGRRRSAGRRRPLRPSPPSTR
jgi:phage portal protein BeeE